MRNVVTWVLSIVLALMFLFAGGIKLSGQPAAAEMFMRFGFPLWFMYLTGAIEVGSAILVLVPRLAPVGAGLLVCVMIGAIFTHLTHGQLPMIVIPIALLLIAIAVGTLRGWRVGQPPSRA